MRRWLLHWLGMDNAAGPIYLGLSGFVGDLALIGGVVAFIVHAAVTYRHRQCEVRRCWRVGRHDTAAGHTVCRHHHPDGAPTARGVLEAHYAALGQPVPGDGLHLPWTGQQAGTTTEPTTTLTEQ